MNHELHLSIIIPAYKEASRIRATLLDLKGYFSDKAYGYEIIIVDDGSPDATADVVEGFRADMPALSLVRLPKNGGKGHAVKVGMEASRGRYRVFMDADNSVKIAELDGFIKKMEEGGHDIAIGSIAFTYAATVEHNGWHRRFLGSLSKLLVRIIGKGGIYDTQRGFKVFTGRAAELVFPKQTIDRWGFDIELLVIAERHGLSIIELPVAWDNPTGSTVTASAYARSFLELFIIFKNKLLGRYDPGYASRVTLRSFGRAILKEIRLIGARLWLEATEPRMQLSVETFSPAGQEAKGNGFRYKGQEFIDHTDLDHGETALYSLVRSQKFFLVCLGFILVIAFAVNWHAALVGMISVITIMYFIDLSFSAYLITRSFSTDPEIRVSEREIARQNDAELPVYTIFCPLYREWQVVPQFVGAIEALDYPRDRLQVVLLLEENDAETIEKTRSQHIPSHFEVVIVPHSLPKTKPKAMNYGLPQARGDFLVIYDAEDKPERDQLKKAVAAFGKVSRETVCIQAKLNFYNVDQNVLTRAFTAEYSLWFDLILPGLQSLGMPIPLGGTSNHFRMSALRELRGWDAFNVTEDCDLGMRLAKRGLRTAIMESTTYEEANSDLRNWYNQRSRWVKGYLQTYIVHMRNPASFKKGWRDLLAFQVTVGTKIFAMLVNPLFWIITLSYFLFRAEIGTFIESFFPRVILYIGALSFVFGNFLYFYSYMIGCAKRRFDHLIKYVFLVPFYWLGMSLAAWRAVYEIVVKPHYWSKTIHGLHLARPEFKPALEPEFKPA